MPSSLFRKTTTNPKDMAINFNNFFTSIGTKLQSNIPPPRKHYIDYLKHPNPKKCFISPITLDEIKNIIKSLKSSKCQERNCMPTKILHLIKNKIPILLSKLINKTFPTGCSSLYYWKYPNWSRQWDFAAGVFIDIKKAFDIVDHDVILILWFDRIIERLVPVQRKQFISISNSTSNTKVIITSVLQGSVLGPLHLLLYINDLHKNVKHSKTLFWKVLPGGFVISDIVFGCDDPPCNPSPVRELSLLTQFSGLTTLQSLVSEKQ